MISKTIADLKVWRLVGCAIVIYLVRGMTIMLFLDKSGNLPLDVVAGGGLPANVDYFFSTTFFIVIILTLASVKGLFAYSGVGNYLAKGVVISVSFLALFLAMDIVVEIIIYHRTFANYFRVVFIDYSPIALIPLFVGMILHKEYLKIRA